MPWTPELRSLACSPPRVVRFVRGHTPDRDLARTHDNGLVEVGHAGCQAIIPTRPHRCLEQHRRNFRHDVAKLRGDTRRRHDVINRNSRGTEMPIIEYIRCSQPHHRFIRAFFLDEFLIAAPRRGGRVADEPWRQFDPHVLQIATCGARFVQQKGGVQGVGMRAGLHIRRTVFVARRDGHSFQAEFGHCGGHKR
jgi:hypothetical protein